MISLFAKIPRAYFIVYDLKHQISIFQNIKSLPKQPLHIPHTPIPLSQQLRLANFHQRAGFAAFAVVGRRSLAAA